jgi:hypothetical protein
MGVALTAIADDDDLLALDQVQVGVAIIINTHGGFLLRGPESADGSGFQVGETAGRPRISGVV